MLFKKLHSVLSKNAGVIVLLLVSLHICRLAFTKQLQLYVHPRYIVFSVVMAICALIIITFGVVHNRKQPKNHDSGTIFSLIVILATLLLVLLKPHVLSSYTSRERSGGSSYVEPGTPKRINLSRNTESVRLKDWVSLINDPTTSTYVLGKVVYANGFVSKVSSSDYFYVSRFIVTCCAVDARPVQLKVYSPGWQNAYSEDDWVNVTGTFIQEPNGEIVIKPSKLEKTDRPVDPYEY